MPALRSPNQQTRPETPSHQANADSPPQDSLITVGRVTGVFGIRGELKIDLLTDFPERFAAGSHLYLNGALVTVERSRDAGRDRMVVKLREINTRTQAEAIVRDTTLDIREDDLMPLPEGKYYRFQLLGLEVWTAEGQRLGAVEDLVVTGSNDVLIVRDDDKKEALIPNTPDIVTIDMDNKRIVVNVVEGLLPKESSENASQSQRRR